MIVAVRQDFCRLDVRRGQRGIQLRGCIVLSERRVGLSLRRVGVAEIEMRFECADVHLHDSLQRGRCFGEASLSQQQQRAIEGLPVLAIFDDVVFGSSPVPAPVTGAKEPR